MSLRNCRNLPLQRALYRSVQIDFCHEARTRNTRGQEGSLEGLHSHCRWQSRVSALNTRKYLKWSYEGRFDQKSTLLFSNRRPEDPFTSLVHPRARGVLSFAPLPCGHAQHGSNSTYNGGPPVLVLKWLGWCELQSNIQIGRSLPHSRDRRSPHSRHVLPFKLLVINFFILSNPCQVPSKTPGQCSSDFWMLTVKDTQKLHYIVYNQMGFEIRTRLRHFRVLPRHKYCTPHII